MHAYLFSLWPAPVAGIAKYLTCRWHRATLNMPACFRLHLDIHSPCCRYAKQTGFGKATGTMQPVVKPHSATQRIRSQSPSAAPQRLSEELDTHLQRPTSRSGSEQQQSAGQPHKGIAREAGGQLQGGVQGGSERGGKQQQRPPWGQSKAQAAVLRKAAGPGPQHSQEHTILPPEQVRVLVGV